MHLMEGGEHSVACGLSVGSVGSVWLYKSGEEQGGYLAYGSF